MKSITPKGREQHPVEKYWGLQAAKAQLSKVVREAQIHGPQHLTLHGKDTAVVISAEEFDRMKRPVTGGDIVEALSSSPLQEVNFERLSVKSPVRDVFV